MTWDPFDHDGRHDLDWHEFERDDPFPRRWLHADTARKPEPAASLADLAAWQQPASSMPPPQAVVEPVALQLQFVTSDGQPVTELALTVTQRGGDFETSALTDAEGAIELVVPDEGSYDVRFDAPPPKLPPPPAEPPSGPGAIYSHKLPRNVEAFDVSAGAEKRIVLVRPAVVEVLVDGYAQGCSVMRWGGMRPRTDGTVATTRAALRIALVLGRGRTLGIAGHADPLGQDADNEALSAKRARSLHLFAAGDLDGWAADAAASATELDLACALAACNRILGLGPVSLDDEEALDAAHAQVRAYAGLADDAPVGVDDWRAFADIYDLDLSAMLQTDLAGLAELRSTISWTDPPTVALGERYPRPLAELADDAGDIPALPHRRSSILVFGPQDGAAQAMSGECEEVYDGTYTRTIVPVPGEVLVQIAIDTPARDPIARGRAWIGIGNLGVAEHTAHVDGCIRFMTLAGDRVEVVAAFDSKGRGTLVSAGTEQT